jgi:diguanylate cyclase (GGDEF)-like protein
VIKFIFLLLFSFTSFAQEICEPVKAPSAVEELCEDAAKVSEKVCSKKGLPNPLDLSLGCLTGTYKAGVDAVEGFIAFFRFLVDMGAKSFQLQSESVKKVLSGELGPAEMASAIADLNIGSHSEIWNKAKEYWNAFKKFGSDLWAKLMTEVDAFPCKTLREQSEIVCNGVTDVFLAVVSVGKVVDGVKLVQAMNRFVKETSKANKFARMSIAERLNKAADALNEGSVLMKLRNAKLREVELPTGEKILKYEQLVKDKNGKLVPIEREVPLDAKTLAIDSNSVIGKEILGELVKSKSGSGSLVYIDVNHLGKVNYFKDGTQAGDQYLKSVAESIRKTLRPGDMIFKNGGDELVVVLGTNNPTTVKDLTQRMMNAVDRNDEVRHLFRQEVKTIVNEYKKADPAKRAEILKFAQEQASYRGSISVGAAVIKNDETLESVLKRAETKAAKVKAEYKTRYGHNVSKYKVEEEFEVGRAYGPPTALDVD